MASRRLLEADLSRGKRHAVIDQQAAQVILESYLNQKNGGSY
jgi:RNase H-fold protein (predicted Holliday junction resolvase)